MTDITGEIRADLFKSVFPETADQTKCDERNDVWTLDVDPAIRNYFLYLISFSNGGATVPGEQSIVFENRYYDLYPFEDNRLGSVSDSRADASLDEAESVCRRVVDSITDTGDYAVDFIHAYGRNGRRPYLKLIFKRMLDKKLLSPEEAAGKLQEQTAFPDFEGESSVAVTGELIWEERGHTKTL